MYGTSLFVLFGGRQEKYLLGAATTGGGTLSSTFSVIPPVALTVPELLQIISVVT